MAAFLEPQLERIDVRPWVDRLSWVVQGCESLGRQKPGRPFGRQWAEDVRDGCAGSGVPYWLKQAQVWGCRGCETWTWECEQRCPACNDWQVRRVVHEPWLDDRPDIGASERIAEILRARGKLV